MLYYISGGQRSGKSRYAQELALELSKEPIYLATSRIWDDDLKARIEYHRDERDERWATFEEEKYISQLDLESRVVVMDCVTLWLTNFFTDNNYQVTKSLEEAKAEFDLFLEKDMTAIVISNEIGMGLHADTEAGRKFTDLQGWMNQYIAQRADYAYLMVSGLPLKLK